MRDEYSLAHFREAQDFGMYEEALQEIKEGKKRGHWMWFIFPQLKGRGFSRTAQLFGIENLEEARAFLEHPLLGSRLRKICLALLEQGETDPHVIFGSPDDLKLKSSMTLFDQVSPGDIFAQVLDKFHKGERDSRSLEILANIEKEEKI